MGHPDQACISSANTVINLVGKSTSESYDQRHSHSKKPHRPFISHLLQAQVNF